jgi:hypothetical protein
MYINNNKEMFWPTVFLMACVINFKNWVLLAVLTDSGKGKLRWLKPVKHPVIENDISWP